MTGSTTIRFWQGNGGPEASYKIEDNGTLAVYRGREVFCVYSPNGWMWVMGPQHTGRLVN